MTEEPGSVSQAAPQVPEATVRRRRRLPLVWLVPLLTAAIAGWLAWDGYRKRGPTITVTFETGSGLTAGQSQLKYKNVVMGTVSKVVVAPDLTHVIVTIATTREADAFLKDGTVFWVVKPQMFAGSFTGLDTLLSGSYIGMRPDPERPGPTRHHFVGQESPPILQVGAKGTTFRLQAPRLGSVSIGSPIFYRDLEVGTVLGWDLGDLAEKVTIHAFVRAPFDQYVRQDSAFWDASGLSVKLGADGLGIRLESLRALLMGGVAFEAPSGDASPAAKPDETFPLYPSIDAARTARFRYRLHLVSYFHESVAGLATGAEVTLYGLRIGEVTEVRLEYDKAADSLMAMVAYQVDGERVSGIAAVQGMPPGTLAAELVRRGLRATLQAPSLISGGKIVALTMIPDAPPASLRRDGDVFVVPSSDTGGFDSLTRSASEMLAKLNRIDFDRIGRSIADAAAGFDQTVNGPQVKAVLANLEASMREVQTFTRRLETDAGPALKRLPALAAQAQDALASANRMLSSVTAGYGEDSRFRRDLDRLMPQLTDAVRSVRALTDLLARHPEALIQGRTGGGP